MGPVKKMLYTGELESAGGHVPSACKQAIQLCNGSLLGGGDAILSYKGNLGSVLSYDKILQFSYAWFCGTQSVKMA